MKTLIALCLVTTLGFSTAQAAQQEGNPQAAKLARDASAAAKDQDWNKAIDLLRKASEMDRKFTTNLAIAYEQRAYSYANDQRFQDALNDLAEAIKIKPGDARAYEQRAAIYIRISDNDKALEDYAEAMKANPGEIKYRNYRAYIYESRGDLENAIAENDAALKINSKNKEALDRKARLDKIKATMGPQQPASAPGVPAPAKPASPPPKKQ
ncbi:MAG TPA: tetratricopeptide repeat protein [Chthoniobacterales bacterium]|jgi:tetratricopeptide (TPR) repeat protein|nr:tetratricopeptide repeat protein [Chthoniobacterales bacterium]